MNSNGNGIRYTLPFVEMMLESTSENRLKQPTVNAPPCSSVLLYQVASYQCWSSYTTAMGRILKHRMKITKLRMPSTFRLVSTL